MSDKRTVIILLIGACIASSLTLFSYWYLEIQSVYQVIEMEMDVYVDSTVGINVDADAVHFGKIPPKASGSRKMNVTAGNYHTMVSFEHYGAISEWTSVSENDIILEPNEAKEVFVQISVPEDAVVPDYRNGTLRIVFRKALF
jgi:hypothetical protein